MSFENQELGSVLLNLSFASTTNYQFEEEIGRGGMGIVYLAERDSQGVCDSVALKLLQSRSEKDTERLIGEANVATSLRHENIIKTYGMEAVPYNALPTEFTGDLDFLSYVETKQKDRNLKRRIAINKRLGRKVMEVGGKSKKINTIGTKEDDKRLLMIVMDYINGTDLAALHYAHVKQKLLLPIPIAAFIIGRVLRALDYAHEYIVHRDISPGNVLINNQGVCKLTDFGVAISADGDAAKRKEFAGKIYYMAPEQVRSKPVDGRSDLFSVGAMAYQLLTGINYFTPPPGLPLKDQVKHVIQMAKDGVPAPHEVRNDIPVVLSNIVASMLKYEPEDRVQSAGKASMALEQKYLYARGFGPTNNSLSAYIDIFEKGFDEPTQEQLRQLIFLKDDEGKIILKRTIANEYYTPLGAKVARERKYKPK